ncbi:MAG: flagellar basal-body rod protein FlgF [Alphaproteobacteria bacterium]|nr:flagellar basal-body rod protein FlgF [Alphaproteobacteria bacterium]
MARFLSWHGSCIWLGAQSPMVVRQALENRNGMENTLYIALSRQMVMKQHLNVVANNMANTSTAGYKGEQLMFVEYLAQTKDGQQVSFVQDLAVVRDFSEGEFIKTGSPLDAAIHGKGWFVVDTPKGQFYTRNGHFEMNRNGEIVNSAGHPVLSDKGQPIVIGPGETDILISGDGTVSTSGGPKGRLNIVNFENDQLLNKVSNSLYTTDQPPEQALKASVTQGMIEGSNVQPIIEVSNMMTALRSYQSAQEVIKQEDGRLMEAIKTLTEEKS